MPELDAIQVAAIGSFAVLVLAWMFAPTATVAVFQRELPAAAAA